MDSTRGRTRTASPARHPHTTEITRLPAASLVPRRYPPQRQNLSRATGGSGGEKIRTASKRLITRLRLSIRRKDGSAETAGLCRATDTPLASAQKPSSPCFRLRAGRPRSRPAAAIAGRGPTSTHQPQAMATASVSHSSSRIEKRNTPGSSRCCCRSRPVVRVKRPLFRRSTQLKPAVLANSFASFGKILVRPLSAPRDVLPRPLNYTGLTTSRLFFTDPAL